MIYVDNLKKYKRQSYCHMIADSIEELHEFANKIGIHRRWFHKNHYDLRAEERLKAVQNGAIETTSKQLVKILKKMS